jgi:phosphohistidine swiveling domain-containing protein
MSQETGASHYQARKDRIMKGELITVQLHDGRVINAIVIHRNGSTLTVKGSEGFIYETSVDAIDSRGIYHAS